jgi:putative membrane protein (TIGR04086 family)
LNIKRNGLISGATIALIYIYIIYFLSSIITKNFSLNGYSILMIITSLLSGAIGGIIGVNIK